MRPKWKSKSSIQTTVGHRTSRCPMLGSWMPFGLHFGTGISNRPLDWDVSLSLLRWKRTHIALVDDFFGPFVLDVVLQDLAAIGAQWADESAFEELLAS